MLSFFNREIDTVPTVWLDTETTGTNAAVDGVVQFGAARFPPGQPPSVRTWLVNPGRPIPKEASEIHGITDAMVAGAPTLDQLMGDEELQRLERAQVQRLYTTARRRP